MTEYDNGTMLTVTGFGATSVSQQDLYDLLLLRNIFIIGRRWSCGVFAQGWCTSGQWFCLQRHLPRCSRGSSSGLGLYGSQPLSCLVIEPRVHSLIDLCRISGRRRQRRLLRRLWRPLRLVWHRHPGRFGQLGLWLCQTRIPRSGHSSVLLCRLD